MSHFKTLYPGRFLIKEALEEPKTIRIMEVITEELENEGGTKEPTVVIKYKAADGEGEAVWCKSNAELTAIALDETDHKKWAGRLITIFHDPNVMFGPKKVGGVRVCGAPDMTTKKTVEIKMPFKKKPDVYHLAPTKAPAAALQPAPQETAK